MTPDAPPPQPPPINWSDVWSSFIATFVWTATAGVALALWTWLQRVWARVHLASTLAPRLDRLERELEAIRADFSAHARQEEEDRQVLLAAIRRREDAP